MSQTKRTKFKEELEKVKHFVEQYAKKNYFKLNSNQEIVETVIEGLTKNKLEYGYQYCPCRIISGDKEQDRDIICPCKWHKEEIEEKGECHCQLFTS